MKNIKEVLLSRIKEVYIPHPVSGTQELFHATVEYDIPQLDKVIHRRWYVRSDFREMHRLPNAKEVFAESVTADMVEAIERSVELHEILKGLLQDEPE